MTDVTRMLTLRCGKHTDVNTFDNTPGTKRVLDPESHGFYPPDYRRLDRKLFSTDNRRFARTIGPKALDPLPLGMRLRGVNNNTGAAIDANASTEVGDLWDSHFGANASVPAGAATTVTGGNGNTPNVTVASGAGFANGDRIMFAVTAPAGFVCREVVSGGGTGTLVLDRKYTGTVSNGTTAFRGASWSIARSVHKHVPVYFDAEGEDWRTEYFGCFSEMLDLDFKEGDVVKAAMSFRPTNWTPSAELNPTFTGATAGTEIVAINASLYIADFECLVKSLKLSMKTKLAGRDSVNGVNGVHGYEAVDKDDVVITGQIYVADVTTLGELLYNSGSTPPSVATLNSTNTVRDMAIEIPAGAGQSFYARIPAADISGSIKDAGGLAVFDFQAYACEPASGSPCKVTLF